MPRCTLPLRFSIEHSCGGTFPSPSFVSHGVFSGLYLSYAAHTLCAMQILGLEVFAHLPLFGVVYMPCEVESASMAPHGGP